MTYTPESVERLVAAVRSVQQIQAEIRSGSDDFVAAWTCRSKPLLDAALASLTEEKECCEWELRKFDSTLNPNIYINCKNEPIVAMYYDLSAKPFCPYCGKPIKEVTK